MTKLLSQEEFAGLLGENIKPAHPIESAELLQGRERLLQEVGRQLASPGMHAFMYGERGVGKTSIALTVAKQQSADQVPCVGCDGETTVFSLVRDICEAILDDRPFQNRAEISGSAGINVGLFKAEASVKPSKSSEIPATIESINQAAAFLEGAIAKRPPRRLIVIDEMDRATNPDFHKGFADLIKRIHDKRVDIRFIMCGIGKNLDEIIGSHLSASRAIAPFEIGRISHDARWKIVTSAAERLGYTINREHYIRLGQISDGYPYYVHLVAQHLFWEIFDHQQTSKASSTEDFERAISKAVEMAEAPLRKSYNFAIQKTTNSNDYEEALWATAAGTHFERQIKKIYEESYLKIRGQKSYRLSSGEANRKEALDIDAFRRRLYSLCSDKHGSILIRKPNSWYAFNENVVRGYVRLVAHRHGIELGADHF